MDDELPLHPENEEIFKPEFAPYFEQAVDTIQTGGWSQGDNGPGWCLWTSYAQSPAPHNIDPMDAVVFDLLGVNDHSSLYAWNDAPERTKEQVIQALYACADACRGEPFRYDMYGNPCRDVPPLTEEEKLLVDYGGQG